jgi:hypothetical protein
LTAGGTFNRTSTDKGSIGARVTSGDASTNGLVGYLHEVVVYNSVLSAQQVAAVERYLGNKWGITVA